MTTLAPPARERQRSARRRWVVAVVVVAVAGVVALVVAVAAQQDEAPVLSDHTESMRAVATTSPEVGLADDFSAATPGPLDPAYLEDAWNATYTDSVSRASVVDEGDNRFVRVLYPEGAVGATDSGATWRAHLPASEEATAEYRVRVEEGFDWTSGGKLPGLAGGSSPTGGTPDDQGFTARYMWQPEGALILYLYHSEQRDVYGDSIDLSSTLVPGRWHTLSQQVVLNTAGEPDGELRVWVDGELVLERTDMRWRTAGSDWSIDSFYFSSFHGGSSDDYRPDRDNHADFDDFVVEPSDGTDEIPADEDAQEGS